MSQGFALLCMTVGYPLHIFAHLTIVGVNVGATDNSAVTRVEVYANGQLLATDIAAPYGFTWDTSTYADGAATLQARAYDAAGNVGSSSTISVTVANDTVPPVVNITNPASGSSVTGSVPIDVVASDNKKVAKISLTINAQEVAIAYGTSLSYAWSTSAKTKGRHTNYTITARAWDAAGNVSTASIIVSR